jgi:hypothetical protein
VDDKFCVVRSLISTEATNGTTPKEEYKECIEFVGSAIITAAVMNAAIFWD